ncbi:hypothetical protein INT44_006558 [Umbelopsis vinacea]|uniref:DNA 3'-5' helicase n=1 Tax=Umbelopsis vinacea TaxID=44442 RepID=A0A8H7PTQ6_9FUNG|nr:hypothetical protein INT44_006558 [Umbelopsis vinacea]
MANNSYQVPIVDNNKNHPANEIHFRSAKMNNLASLYQRNTLDSLNFPVQKVDWSLFCEPVQDAIKITLREFNNTQVQYLKLLSQGEDHDRRVKSKDIPVSSPSSTVPLDPWKDDAMTQIVVGAGELILGKKIDVRAWRQITIGIAIQKFKMTEANKMIDEGGDDKEMDPALGSMSDVLHWQAGHNPNTGNRFYGRTVDFRGGLTDAGLQQFRFASELWHHFVRNPMQLPRLVVPPAPSAAYRSSGQQKAMEYVLAGSGQVLAILRTNEGKSLLYLLPCQLPHARTTVVILPLVVLKAEMERRCKVAGIKAHVWGAESDSNKLHSRPLVIAAVEQAVGRRFQAFLNRLHVANGLDRVVYDECHVAITAATYRISMELLPMLRQLPIQTIFLTGTMPPSMVSQFEKKMLLRGARLVRSSTMRRDIHFQISECAPKIDFVHDFSVPRIQEVIRGLAAGTRAIFYCSLKDVIEEVALAIDAPMYHSTSDNVEEKAKVLEQWRAGKPPYIVATSAFGMGIDHPKVRSVVHVGVPWSAIDFAQDVGRLGRDGDGGQSTVLVPHLWKDTTTDRNRRPLDNAEAAMHSYLSTICCRVLELSRYLDGEGGSPCIPESPMCDQCRGAIAPSVRHGHSSAMTESDDDLEDLQAGAELLQTRIQTQARGLADYTASLET